jgi:hypothetical protein
VRGTLVVGTRKGLFLVRDLAVADARDTRIRIVAAIAGG